MRTFDDRGSVSLTVRIVDAREGTPVAGARVVAGELSATTSEQGEAVLRPVSPGWMDMWISAAGYATLRTDPFVSSAPETRLDIRLSRALTIGGVVVDEHGAPVRRATIYVLGDFDVPLGGERSAAVTDERGRFRVTDVAAGVRRIFAIDERHAPASSPPLVVERDQLDVVVTMRKGSRLDGRVVDASGAPVGDAVVHAAVHAGWYSRQAVTGEDGTFCLEGLGRSFFYVRGKAAIGVSTTDVVDLRELASQSIELRLLRNGTIAGTVVDHRGQPCASEPVNAMLCENDSTYSSATTDATGRFTIERVPEGEHVVWAGPFSDQDFGLEEVRARTGDTDVVLRRTAFGSIRGEVAIEDATHPPKEVLVTIFGTTVGVHRTYQAMGTGVFELEGLPPDSYHLGVNGSGFVDTRLDVTVVANQATDLGTLVVPRGRSASGRVVDETGAPVSGARVRLGEVRRRVTTFRDDQWDAISDPSGHFTIAGLRDTTQYLIVATHDSGCSQGVEISPTSDLTDPLTVVLLPCGSIVGTVVDAGTPVREIMVAIGDPENRCVFTDENGAFAFARIPTGRIPIRVIGSGSLTPLYEREIDVHAGKPVDVTIDLRRSTP